MIVIGLFELDPLDPGRWRVLNTRTGVSYVTYGTEEEVVQVLKDASVAWERRLKSPKTGWREKMQGEARENAAAKKARESTD